MSRKKKRDRTSLIVRLFAELGKGRVSEAYLHDPKFRTEGYQSGRHIWVAPHYAVADSCIHELLHRMYGNWPEAYVRSRTTFVLNRMTDSEVQAFYDTYQSVARKRKSRLDVSEEE
jgi:hypothetical protein